MATHALILDFDGVVAASGFTVALEALAQQCSGDRATIQRAALRALRHSGYIHGRGPEAGFWSALEAAAGPLGSAQTFRARLVQASVLRAWPLALAQALGAMGWQTAVLSDHTDWLDEIEARTPFAHAFGLVRNSYYTGCIKTDPAAFQGVLEALGAAPGDAIFVDDSPYNVACARGLGITAVLWPDGPALRDALAVCGVAQGVRALVPDADHA